MSFFDKFQAGLEKIVGPFATMVAQSKHITALTEGFMLTMPVTLGVAIIAVLSNLPIPAWIDLLKDIGIYDLSQDVISLTLSLLAIYVVGAIGYSYTKNAGKNGMHGAVLCTASFIMLIPIQIFNNEAGIGIKTIALSYLGSDGIFVALVVGLVISSLYCWLMDKNLVLKLPEAVPPMVSQSLAPTFVSMIIFFVVFMVKYACTFTSYGDVFLLLTGVIGKPITAFGATPIAMIMVFTLMNLFWFFGIHPNTILMCYLPILSMTGPANTEAFLNGETLPYLAISIVGTVLQIGGAGNTFGLCIATFFAKSEKYKALRKVVIPANLFNINEPILFGFPLMLNPIYFIPMVFSPLVSGFVVLALLPILDISINPTISMPWVTPGFVSVFFTGGISLLLIWLLGLAIHFIMYLPFFMMDDRKELQAERKYQEESEAVEQVNEIKEVSEKTVVS